MPERTDHNEAMRLADSIKTRAVGWTEWRVENPVDGGYVMVFTQAESLRPEKEAKEWLELHKQHHPNSMYADYVVAKHHCYSRVEQDALDAAALLRQQAERIAEFEKEVADLYTTMFAAAVEIQEHWDAHCDAEGYGPANLMHRLERGIASQYGYDAKTLERIEAERDQLREEVERMRANAERYVYLRNRQPSDVIGQTGPDAGCWIDCDDSNGELVLLTGEDADAAIDQLRTKP